MSPEAQRIAIAEVCGWKKNHGGLWWKDETYDNEDGLPPDYLNDLNAVHEAEKTLTDEQKHLYVILLLHGGTGQGEVMGTWHCLHATAAQRCEALLKTLNLWTDEPQTSKVNP